MSERHVIGFLVSTELLWDLVGSGLAPGDLLDDAAGEVAELDFHLARSWPGMTAERLARDVFAGQLDEANAGDVVRLLAPLLDAVAFPVYGEQALWIQETMALDWPPALKALGLPTLAAHWEQGNIAWPWPRGTSPRSSWPVVTELPPVVLEAVRAEFAASGWRSALEDLPYDALEVDDPEDVREELAENLEQLAAWLLVTPEPGRRCVAPDGNSLVLIMDGDM
ncbi:hypothetical protein [Dactylosporangium sp. NPDC005555]|uniref:hypothetical protein n=1 Tax=Dactylosporangium sp. NPDC005555 TaxID=3154889 RepID=UPI0033A6D295